MPIIQNRRHFLASVTAAGAAGLIGSPTQAWAESPPETTTVRLGRWVGGASCWGSLYLAGELLRADGMTDVQYIQGDKKFVDNSEWLATGVTDFDFNMPTMHIRSIEAGTRIKILAGVHTGCWELRASDSVNRVLDLKGKRIGIWAPNDHPHVFLELIVNYVGLDPARDVEWVVGHPMQDFVEGKVDAFLADPTQLPKADSEKIGHTVLNNLVDRPWSEYFCCMIAGSADYIEKYPAATKHVLRAVLKSADFCASNPTAAARELVDRGFLSYEDAFVTLQQTRHDKWRDYDAEDSVRFYALRMGETGMIESSPQEILAKGTDFHTFDELKRELKA